MSRPFAALAALLLAALANTAPAWSESRVEVAIEPPTITVGDPTTAAISLTLDGGATAEPRFPDWSRGWGDAQVLGSGPIEKLAGGGATRYVQRLQLTAFRTGRIDLPPVAIRLGPGPDGVVTTPAELALEVRSVLPGEAAQATPMPPEPPRPLPRPAAALWTIGALALAIAAAAWFARRAGAGVEASASTPALAPFPELEAALSALAGEAPAPGHARLSAALRRYLGRALGFPAVESTTREIERQLAARRLDPALVARSARLLREVDQVKFARRASNAEELERRRGEALAAATSVEAHLRPAPAAAEDAA